jgi:LysR family transcriptional regulator, glycine cleavage system transcriptional activator
MNESHLLNARLPSFRLLAGFEAAARLGSYVLAADELCVSPSAVSHQIAQLEAQLDQPLFRRKGRGVELTVAGRVLQESVVRSLGVIRSGLQRIGSYFDEGLVTLVCPAPVAHGWLQPRLDALIATLPGLCPVVSVDETARYIDELDVDIAISRRPLDQPGVREVALMADALVAVGVPALVDSVGDGGKVELLCLESDLTGQVLRERFGGLRRQVIYDDPRLLLDAVLRGRGVALVSRLLADEALLQGRLMRLPGHEPVPAGTLWIACIDGVPRSPLVTGLFEGLRQAAMRMDERPA